MMVKFVNNDDSKKAAIKLSALDDVEYEKFEDRIQVEEEKSGEIGEKKE